MSTLAAHIERLTRIRNTFARDRALFWARHRDAYREQCAELVRTMLMLVRPEHEPVEGWGARVNALAESVATRLFGGGDLSSLLIFLATQNIPVTGPLEDFLTRDTVLRWVQAGREGDPLGKEFTPEDYARKDEHIAGLVLWENLRGRARNTPAALRIWIEGQALEHFGPYMQPILTAWHAALAGRVRSDFRQWVGEVVRG